MPSYLAGMRFEQETESAVRLLSAAHQGDVQVEAPEISGTRCVENLLRGAASDGEGGLKRSVRGDAKTFKLILKVMLDKSRR